MFDRYLTGIFDQFDGPVFDQYSAVFFFNRFGARAGRAEQAAGRLLERHGLELLTEVLHLTTFDQFIVPHLTTFDQFIIPHLTS